MHKNVKWANHINIISNKVNSVLAFVQRNLKHATRDLKELAYALLYGLSWNTLLQFGFHSTTKT